MTTVAIVGRITEIEYEASFAIVSLSTGVTGVNSPTTINPSGNPVTIVLATATGASNLGASGFIMSSSFNVGDVVEIYCQAGTNGRNNIGDILDENSNNLTNNGISGPGMGGIFRKVLTGAGLTWGAVGHSSG